MLGKGFGGRIAIIVLLFVHDIVIVDVVAIGRVFVEIAVKHATVRYGRVADAVIETKCGRMHYIGIIIHVVVVVVAI